jgi:two-component system, cell cycle response regulator
VPYEWDEQTKVSNKTNEPPESAAHDRSVAYLIVLAGTGVGEMHKLTRAVTTIGRGSQADIQVTDEGISRRHAEIHMNDQEASIHDLGSTNGTYCNGERVTKRPLADGDKIQVGSTTILKFTFHDSLDESFQRQMYESALRDGLTKIFNKRYFQERLESEFSYAMRHRSPLSLLLFDLDHFKNVNDTCGHLAGDHALVTLTELVAQTMRQEDVLARYGGEEFVILCRGVDRAGALVFAERVRKLVAAQSFVYEGRKLQVTISVGVASLPPDGMENGAQLVQAADDALYEAKRAGRNRVHQASVESTKPD